MDALLQLATENPAAVATAIIGVLLSIGIALYRVIKKPTAEQVASLRTTWLVILTPLVSAIVATAATGWDWGKFIAAIIAGWAASQTTYQTGRTVARAVPPLTEGSK